MKLLWSKRTIDALEQPAQSTSSKRRKISTRALSDFPVPIHFGASIIPLEEDGSKRDRKYYAVDGDIILKSETTLFRAHTAILAKLGGFFEGLPALSRPKNDSICLVDKEVLVCLLPDTKPRDIRYMLAFAYGNLSPKATGSEFTSLHWNSAISLLCISRRFDLATVRHKVVEALRLVFPSGSKYSLDMTFPALAGVRKADRKLFARIYPLQAINLFREYGLHELMPMAYYRAAQLAIADIIKGVVCGDSTVVTLPQADIVKVLEGREKLRRSRRTILLAWLANHAEDGQHKSPSDECLGVPSDNTGETCAEYVYQLLLAFNKSGYMDTNTDVLSPLLLQSDEFRPDLCLKCFDVVASEIMMGVDDNWEQLPCYFGFKDWPKVMRAQEIENERWRDLK